MIAINLSIGRIAFVPGLPDQVKYNLLRESYKHAPGLILRKFPECFTDPKKINDIPDIIDISWDDNYSNHD